MLLSLLTLLKLLYCTFAIIDSSARAYFFSTPRSLFQRHYWNSLLKEEWCGGSRSFILVVLFYSRGLRLYLRILPKCILSNFQRIAAKVKE